MWFLRTHFSERPLRNFPLALQHACRVPSGHPIPSAPQTHDHEEGPIDVPEGFHQHAPDMPTCAWARPGSSQNASFSDGAGWIVVCPGYVCLPRQTQTCVSFRLQGSIARLSFNPTSPSIPHLSFNPTSPSIPQLSFPRLAARRGGRGGRRDTLHSCGTLYTRTESMQDRF